MEYVTSNEGSKTTNKSLDEVNDGIEDGSADLFIEKDVDGDEMWFGDKEKPRKRVEKLPKWQQTAKITSSDKVVEIMDITSENSLFNSNSDTKFAPVSESHEKPSESSIANKHEISTISSNSVTEKSQYSNCKVCKIKILFKHINIHMKKHRKPLSYDSIRYKNKIDRINQFPDKSQSTGKSLSEALIIVNP